MPLFSRHHARSLRIRSIDVLLIATESGMKSRGWSFTVIGPSTLAGYGGNDRGNELSGSTGTGVSPSSRHTSRLVCS